MVATEPFVGRPVLRKEDPELITGEAQYIDNWTMPGMAWMALVRPPYVHATIEGIDTTEAAAMPGVVASSRLPTSSWVACRSSGRSPRTSRSPSGIP